MNRAKSHPTCLTALMILLCLALFAGPRLHAQADPNAGLVKDLLGASSSLGLDWAKLFDDTGRPKDEVDAAGNPGANGVPDYVDWYGGIDGCAMEDNISAGVALDMSAVAGGPAIAQCIVYNGTVAAAHDQGNSYMFAINDSGGDLVVYLGVERLASTVDTHVEVELNQDRVRVTTGAPWPVQGGRTDDDLLVRVDYSLGAISGVEVKRWVGDGEGGGSFQSVATYGGPGASDCGGAPTACLFCSGAPPIAAPQEVWDAAGNPLAATPPDDFLEIGINVGALLGAYVEYTAIQVRTPEDIAFGNFRAIGYWGSN